MTPRHELPTPGPAIALAASIAAAIPTLRTERLILRPPALSDFPAFADIVCGPRGAYVGGPMSREDAWFDFAGMCANWLLHGHGGWTITKAGDDTPLGFVVLGLEPGDREPELGFLMTEAGEGHGYAEEAARAARAFAFDRLKLDTLVSYVSHGNTRSVALAERLGATPDRDAEAQIDDAIHVYRHRRRANA